MIFRYYLRIKYIKFISITDNDGFFSLVNKYWAIFQDTRRYFQNDWRIYQGKKKVMRKRMKDRPNLWDVIIYISFNKNVSRWV